MRNPPRSVKSLNKHVKSFETQVPGSSVLALVFSDKAPMDARILFNTDCSLKYRRAGKMRTVITYDLQMLKEQ